MTTEWNKKLEPTWRVKGSFPINKQLQDAIRGKHTTHRQWMSARKRSDANDARLRYIRERNKVKSLLRQAKRTFERGIARKAKSNPKTFWSHVRSRLKTKSGVAPLLENNTDENSMTYSDEERANIFQKQFSSVFVKERDGEIPRLNRRSESSISDLHVTSDMVKQEIFNMKVNKS